MTSEEAKLASDPIIQKLEYITNVARKIREHRMQGEFVQARLLTKEIIRSAESIVEEIDNPIFPQLRRYIEGEKF